MKAKNAFRKYGVIGTMFFILLSFLLLSLGHGDTAFSEKENRVLQQRPRLSASAVSEGSFQAESEAWLSDQFFQRTAFVQLHANLERTLGKRELQDVIIGNDGILFQKQEEPDDARIKEKAGQLKAFAERYQKKKVSMMLVPNKAAIWKDCLPVYEQGYDQLAILKAFHKELPSSMHWIDVVTPLQSHRDEELYYASDHHWTTQGAAVAFDAWCAAEKKKEKTEYEVYTVNDQFYGTLANASGYYRGKKDRVDIYVAKKRQDLVVTYVQEQRKTASVFEQDKAASANPYDVFFDGNHGLMQIDTAHGGKNLLVIKDSYANCFLPFLVPYYRSITVVDPRYYYDDLDKLIKEQGIQEILFLYNANTFFSDDSLGEILEKKVVK